MIDFLEIERKYGDVDRYGDTMFTATAGNTHFNIDLDRSTGRDRDNYDASDHAEIDLTEEEAHELLLLLTVWLEQRA